MVDPGISTSAGRTARPLRRRARAVLAGDDAPVDGLASDRLQRLQHLELLVTDVLLTDVRRGLHRDQAQQLQQVVLDHVPQRTGPVVVPTSTAHAQRLRRGDLHVVDAVGVPQRLEEGVGEAGHQQVLDALLAEVVVDPEDLVLLEHRTDGVVDLECRRQVAADRLLQDQARVRRDQAMFGEAFADRSEECRADRQVEDPDAVGVVEHPGQVRPAVAALDVDADVGEAGDEPVEGWRVELAGAYEAGQLAADLVAVAVVVQSGAGERDDATLGGSWPSRSRR